MNKDFLSSIPVTQKKGPTIHKQDLIILYTKKIDKCVERQLKTLNIQKTDKFKKSELWNIENSQNKNINT